MERRELTNYERKKLLDKKLDEGAAAWDQEKFPTLDEYMDHLEIPRYQEIK